MDIVTREFKKLVDERYGHRKMQMSRNNKSNMRLRFRRGLGIRESTMRKYLQRAGLRINDSGYGDADVIAAIKFAIGKNKHAKNLGSEYLFESWKNSQIKNQQS